MPCCSHDWEPRGRHRVNTWLPTLEAQSFHLPRRGEPGPWRDHLPERPMVGRFELEASTMVNAPGKMVKMRLLATDKDVTSPRKSD